MTSSSKFEVEERNCFYIETDRIRRVVRSVTAVYSTHCCTGSSLSQSVSQAQQFKVIWHRTGEG